MFSPGRKLAVVVALVLLVSGGTLGLLQLRTVRTHQSTAGTVTSAEMHTYDSGVGARVSGETTFYQPTVSYEYTVDGETYTADNIAFGADIDTNSRDRAASILSRYETGESVTVYYNPANPGDAFLIPRLNFLPAGGVMIAGLLLFADSLTPWSRVTRAVLRRIPLSMHIGGQFSADNANAIATENPTAILEARETMEAPRTAPMKGADASAVWLVCCIGIVLTVVGYLTFSHPPYDVGAFAALGIPVVLNARVFVNVTRS